MERHAAHPQAQLGQAKPAAWDHYFAQLEWDAQDRRAQLLAELASFFASPAGWPLLLGVAPWYQRVVLEVDWEELVHRCPSADLREALEHAPAEALDCLGAAAYEVRPADGPAGLDAPAAES